MATSDDVKLSIYNAALRHLGERKLASLTEDRAPRRSLDDAWSEAMATCLEAGLWNFAMLSVSLDPDVGKAPTVTYTYAFDKPADWVRTAVLSGSDTFVPPLLEYADQAGLWLARVNPLYARYVSNGASYGGDLLLWPQSFQNYVAAHLAFLYCPRNTENETKLQRIAAVVKDARAIAMAKDAENDPVKFPPTGTWALSRATGNYYGSQRYLRG